MVKRAFKDEMTFQGTDHDVGDHGVLPTAEDNHVVNPTRDENLAVQCTNAFLLPRASLYILLYGQGNGRTAA
jgi:hypothetical protein